MAYWQYKKIPLFLLASPTYWFIFKALKKTVEDTSFRIIKTDFFGTRSARAGLPWAGVAMQICCWVHLIFISLFCLFFMNVEVVTRLVWSSSPLSKFFKCYKCNIWNIFSLYIWISSTSTWPIVPSSLNSHHLLPILSTCRNTATFQSLSVDISIWT